MTGLTIRHAQATDINAIMDMLRQVNDVHAHGRPDLDTACLSTRDT